MVVWFWFKAAGNNSWNQNQTTIKTFVCPSDFTTWNSYPNAGTSYAFNVMVFGQGSSWDQSPGSLVNSMPDGTSNTVTFAERYRLCQPSSGGHTDPVWAANPWSTPNGMWAVGGVGYTSSGNSTVSGYYPDWNQGIPFQKAPAASAGNWYVMQSAHTGTTNAAL